MFDRVLLQFSTQSDWSSACIRYLTRGDYSHVDMILPDGRFLGARFVGGVQVRPEGYVRFSKWERFTVATAKAGEIYAWALSQVGKPYDWKALFGDAFNRDWNDANRWFCSELVCAAFEAVAYPLIRTDHLNGVMPSDLLLSPYLDPWDGEPLAQE